MPTPDGRFKGQGYSAKRAAGWERVFGRAAESAREKQDRDKRPTKS